MSRLWVKTIRKHKIVKHDTTECTWGSHMQALTELLKRFDAPSPMWLNKHEREFDEFRRTSFSREHFVEEVPFDRLEVEFLADDDQKKMSRDPRNQF